MHNIVRQSRLLQSSGSSQAGRGQMGSQLSDLCCLTVVRKTTSKGCLEHLVGIE